MAPRVLLGEDVDSLVHDASKLPKIDDAERSSPGEITQILWNPFVGNFLCFKTSLRSNTVLGRYSGECISLARQHWSTLSQEGCDIFDCLSYVGGYPYVIRPGPRDTLRLAGHSCAPNCEMSHADRDMFPALVIKRAVRPGDEVTWDYGAVCNTRREWFETVCNCAEVCRGLDTPDKARLFSGYEVTEHRTWERNLWHLLQACKPNERRSSTSSKYLAPQLCSHICYISLPEWGRRYVALLLQDEATACSSGNSGVLDVWRFVQMFYAYCKVAREKRISTIVHPFTILNSCAGNHVRFKRNPQHAASFSTVKFSDKFGVNKLFMGKRYLEGLCIYWHSKRLQDPEASARKDLRSLQINRVGAKRGRANLEPEYRLTAPLLKAD